MSTEQKLLTAWKRTWNSYSSYALRTFDASRSNSTRAYRSISSIRSTGTASRAGSKSLKLARR